MKGSPSDFSSQERALLPKEAEQKSLAEDIKEIPSLQNEIENDFVMIEKEGSLLEKAALQTILKSLTKAELEKVNSFNDMIDLLHKIVPNQHIPRETFDELQKSFSDVLQSKKKSNYEFI